MSNNDPIGFITIETGDSLSMDIEPSTASFLLTFYERETIVDLIVALAFLLQDDE